MILFKFLSYLRFMLAQGWAGHERWIRGIELSESNRYIIPAQVASSRRTC